MPQKFMSGEDIITQRKKQGFSNENKALSGDDILRSRGRNTPADSVYNTQNIESIRVRNYERMKKLSPTQTMTAIPKQNMPSRNANVRPVVNDIGISNNTTSKNNPGFMSRIGGWIKDKFSSPQPTNIQSEKPFIPTSNKGVPIRFDEKKLEQSSKVAGAFTANLIDQATFGMSTKLLDTIDKGAGVQALEQANKESPVAANVGAVSGNLVPLLGVSKLVKYGLKSVGITKAVHPMVERALSNVITGALVGGGEAAGHGANIEDTLKEAGRNALFMGVGGAASDVVGDIGAGILKNAPGAIKNSMAADIGLKATKGATFGAAGTAATYPTYSEEERPGLNEFLKQATTMALFEAIPGVVGSIKLKKNAGDYINARMSRFAKTMAYDYSTARVTRVADPQFSVEKYNGIINDIDDSISALKKNRYVGQGKKVNEAVDLMDRLKGWITSERDMVIKNSNPDRNILASENEVAKPEQQFNNDTKLLRDMNPVEMVQDKTIVNPIEEKTPETSNSTIKETNQNNGVLEANNTITQAVRKESGNKVNLKQFGHVEVLNDDGSTVTLRNSNGTELKIGKTAFENLKVGNVNDIQQNRNTEVKEPPVNNPVKTTQPIEVNQTAPLKLGRYGKANFEKWGKNEHINADLSKPEHPYTQAYKKFFDYWYGMGQSGKEKQILNNPVEFDGENFPPFLEDVFYHAGKQDYEAGQNKIKANNNQVENTTKGDKMELNNSSVQSDNVNQNIANNVKGFLKTGTKFTSDKLFEIANKAFGGTQAEGKYTPKDAYDAMELAVNQHIKENNNVGDVTVSKLSEVKRNISNLQRILDILPTQTKRTKEMEQFQQFSTPPSIAYVAGWVANVKPSDVVLEPSAGIGGLAVFAKKAGAKVYTNEFSKRRLEVLKNMGFDEYFNEDAEQLNNILPEHVKPSLIIMNPPFSATAGRMGDKNSTKNAINHIEQALKRLEPNGRLVAIVGRGMADSAPAFRQWWADIKKEYNVRANVGISGKNYTKYGTSFDIQLFVIDKTGPTKGNTLTGTVEDLTELPNLLEGIRNERPNYGAEPNNAINDVQKTPTGNEGGAGQQPSVSVASNKPGNQENGVNSSNTKRPVKQHSGKPNGKPELSDGEVATDGTGEGIRSNDTTIRTEADNRKPESGEGTTKEAVESSSGSGEQPKREPSIKTEVKSEKEIEEERELTKDDENSVYTTYVPQKLKIKGSKEHTTALVQSAAMSAVEPPDPTYTPHLPEKIINQGILSLPQLESVVYAGQAHEQIMENGERKGFFIGDGTGVGKGRQIAGIILDNFMQGRKKAVWISNGSNLYSDAIRDWTALGGKKDEVFELRKVSVKNDVPNKAGIMFTTYDTLRSGSKFTGDVTKKGEEITRLNQIIKWLGKDYDGVIVFDEAHNMGNAVPTGTGLGKKLPSQKALAGVELQKMLPKARIVYASATGATDVHNLAYGTRLGLWGEGTDFKAVNDFIEKISSGGIAAMELVARDMKSMGVYIARNVSFEGVEYDTVQHDLNPIQEEIYNTMADSWQIVLQNIEKALKETKQHLDSRKKSAARSAFWSANQRFYNQIITSMSMPSVVENIKRELNNGNAIVIQIVNTNQAAADRQISKAEENGTDIEDLDLTPSDTLIQFVDNSFPIQQFEEYIDEEGHRKSRPVYDSQGNPVINKEMQKKKEELIATLKEMKVPDGPLEILLDTFGIDNVAEVTGRNRRVVMKKDEKTGKMKRTVEKRTPVMAEADAQAFQDGKKNILIFSDAGGTGKSYHADKNAKNQKRRIHFLLQPGWNAFKATQGIGRTHRSNQVVAPIFRLVTTNLMGQKRFISTIARRLDQLGALTKGQRQAGSGIFSEKDNLEGPLASDTLQYFYRELFNDRIPGINDGKDIIRKMGLFDKLTDKYGAYSEDLETVRDVGKFLNRILNLRLSEQNKVFEGFYDRLDMAFNRALEAGTLDIGLENYKAEKVVVNDEQVIRKDEVSGAETKYISMTAYKKPYIMGYSQVTGKDKFAGFVRINDTGEVRAVLKSANKTLLDGSISETFKLLSPMIGKESNYIKKTFDEKTTPIDKSDWKAEWKKEIDKQPKFREENIHLLTGTLLPIWGKLPQRNTRVLRVIDDKGKAYLGRLIAPDEIAGVLSKFSLNMKRVEYDAKDLFNKVLNDGSIIELENKIKVERRRVSRENRIELAGVNIWYFIRNIPGVITETINYKRRYFIPIDEKGIPILEKVIKENPVVNVSQRLYENDSDEETFSSSNSGPAIGKATGDNTTGKSKRASEIFSDFADKLDIAIRRKPMRGTLGTFNNQTYIVRIKKANDIAVLSHETGHMLDRIYDLSTNNNQTIRTELEKLGAAVSKKSYAKVRVRREGIAEFTRLYLTDSDNLDSTAPETLNHFESNVPEDVIKVLKDFRKDIWNLTNLNPWERVRKSIHYKGDKKRKEAVDFPRLIRKAYTGLYDSTFPVEWAAGELDGKAGKEKLGNMLAKFRGYEGIAISDLFNEQTDLKGKVIGKSYEEIVAPIHENEEKRRSFFDYSVSRRAKDYFDRGLDLPDTKETYEETIRHYESLYPDFPSIFDETVNYRENNTHLLVEAGIYKEDKFDEMLDSNPNYVSLKRIIEVANRVAGSGKGIGGAKKVVKKVKGGGEDILDPEESDINNTFIYRSVAIRNDILRKLADMADKAEGMGHIMSRSPRKLTSTAFNLQQVEKELKDMGVDTEGLDLDMLVRIFNPNYLAGPNQVVVYEHGEPTLYDIHPDVYEAVSGLRVEPASKLVEVMMSIANISKAGIIFTPKYITYNAARDIFHSLITSNSGINLIDIIGGFHSAIVKDEEYKLAMKKGGTVNHFSANDRKFAQEAIDEIMAGQSKARKFWNVMQHPVNAIHNLIEPTEMASRIAELKKHLKKLGHSEEEIEKAIKDMRNLSIDFRMMGSWIKKMQLNRMTNFLNSQLQGSKNVVKVMWQHPIRTLLRGLLYITLPTLFLMWLNKDNDNYHELSWWRKDFFFNIPFGDPKSTKIFIPIPKPWEFGIIFGALPERFITAKYEKDPEGFKEFWASVRQTIVPEFIPSAAQPVIQDYGGMTWNGIPILSKSDEGVSPYLQFNEYTSELSKAVANATKDIPFVPEAIKSPKRFDQIIKGYTGTLGDIALDSIDIALGKKAGIPVVGGLFNNLIVDSNNSPQSVQDFYDNKKVLDTEYGDSRRLKVDMDKTDQALRTVFNDVNDTLSKLYDLKRAVEISELAEDKKRLEIAAINSKIIEITKKSNQVFYQNHD